MSNSLDLDQAGHFVRPDQDPNCLQRLSAADRICRWQAKELKPDVSLQVPIFWYIEHSFAVNVTYRLLIVSSI